MSNHGLTTRAGLGLASVVVGLSLAACGSSGSTDSAGPSSAPSSPADAPSTATVTATVSATATVTATVEPSSAAPTTPASAPPSSPSRAATALATKACRTWKKGDGQSAAAGSGRYEQAANTARSAAQAAGNYDRLSQDMGFVSGLPLTSNTQQDINKAQKAVSRIMTTCKRLGVPGIRQA